jgi:hypothetical protein
LGLAALIIFLGSLVLAFLSLIALVGAGMQIYRTLRYARKDSEAYLELFKERNRDLQETLKVMEKRAKNITDIGMEMRERVDDIQDVVEEFSRNPLISTAKFVGKHRPMNRLNR